VLLNTIGMGALLQEKQIKVADQRTRQMSELLTNIKSTKLYNWEGFFMSRILGRSE
jgi:ATP-binding cassette subfamily C (CFTR/MRP) protein 1